VVSKGEPPSILEIVSKQALSAFTPEPWPLQKTCSPVSLVSELPKETLEAPRIEPACTS
jgi:hypothetical protein